MGQKSGILIAPPLDTDASPLDQQRLRVLDHLLDLDQELHGRRPVDDAMVVGEGQGVGADRPTATSTEV